RRLVVIPEQTEEAAGRGSAVARDRGETIPGHGDLGADGDARIKIEHILIVQADAALRHPPADPPWRIGAMNFIGAAAPIQGPDPERVHGMAARHRAWQARIFRHHGRRWCPRRIDPLVGDAGHALPTALLARDGDRIAERLPGLRNVVEPTITEADDDLAPG